MPKKNLTIPIYKAEREAGLAKTIQANASIAYVSQLQDTKLSQEVMKEFLSSVAGEANRDFDQFDLYYLNTILVTVGWNKNDDVFPADETWAARYTPIHKQFNLEHDQSKIIGHMTTAKAVNEDFSLIDDDVSVDDLPSKFHILTGAVIYRALADETAQENINKIIEEIEAGEWYVSMECLFRGFDYALTSSTGEQKFLARNEQTAFLTKHLRSYGGSGSYEDFKLGRALKNITFSGKGLVRKPANPESVILFNDGVKNFNASYASLGYITSSNNLIPTKGNDIMAENENADKVKGLENKITELVEANKKLTDEIKSYENSQTTAKITALEADKATSAEKIATLEDELKTVNTKVSDLQAKLTETEARAVKAENEVLKAAAEKIVADRTAMLVAKNFSPEKAAHLVKVFADKSDEDFNATVELFAPDKVVEAVETKSEEKVPAVTKEDVVEETQSSVVITDTDADFDKRRQAMASVFAEMIKV